MSGNLGEGTTSAQGCSQLILVIGGARSGKSTFAEQLAARSGRSVAYIATATASDDDMRDRIARHQAARPSTWLTIEEPLHLAEAVRRATSLADIVLLDCITVWLSNWLLAQEELLPMSSTPSSVYSERAMQEIEALLRAVATLNTPASASASNQAPNFKKLVVVTNEVGLGIVPAFALGRVYRDVLGLVNKRLAEEAARVYLMVAGLAVDIKRLHEEASL
jgi:adenosylcobinamide kinase/adenosylcobinamide-phosphate guanylyltransferase